MRLEVALRTRLGELRLDVSLEAEQQPLAVIGPNGAGKTTLLRTIAGALQPDSGRIRCGARVLLDTQRGVDLPPEQRSAGYVPQGYALFPHLRAIDNVAYGLTHLSSPQRRARAVQMLSELDAQSLAQRYPAELSGGERQRIALARALIVEPDVLLLDEPLAAIDVAARRGLRRVLCERLRHRSRPAIIVSHDIRDLIALNARVCVLDAGKVVQQGSMSDVFNSPINDFVAEFCGADLEQAGGRATTSVVANYR